MRTMNKPAFHKSRFVLPLLMAAALATAACQGPEIVPLGNTYPAPDGNEYGFDLLMISEWAGNVLPSASTFELAVDVSGSSIITADDAKTPLDSVLRLDSEKKDASFFPYGTDADVSFPCRCKLNDDGKCPESKRTYSCTVYQSGAAGIAETWAGHLGTAADRDHTIIVGSGDDFGTSQSLSARFDDLPAVHLLTQLGMTADTLGNHNFDRDLGYLTRLLEYAGFPHVASNIYNVPNNLEHTSQYRIVNIPASGTATANPLPVAIVGVIDPGLIEIIGRGHFGTMEIENYCALIHTMEEAYNKNARVFVLLSHVMTDSESIRDFFHALFSLDKGFAGQLRSAKTDYPYPCQSRLNVTQEMLDAYRTANPNATADDVRAQMRKDILHGIAIVYGENSSEPILTPLVPATGTATEDCPLGGTTPATCPKDNVDYPVNGCNTQVDNKDAQGQYPLFTSMSRLAPACGTSDRSRALSTASLQSFDVQDLDREDAPHPLWFAEIPGHATHTARANFKVVPDTPIPGITSRYRVQMEHFQMEPVLDAKYSEANASRTKCAEILSADYIPKSCAAYLEDHLTLARKKFLDENTDALEKQLDANTCLTDMAAVQVGHDAAPTVRDLQNAWECIYNGSRWEWLPQCDNPPANGARPADDANCYTPAYICYLMDEIAEEGETLTIAGEDKSRDVRVYSTLIVNMLTTMVLEYAMLHYNDRQYFSNMDASKKPDLLYINVGTIRESKDFEFINDDILSTALPFDNDIVITEQTGDKLRALIEFGLNSSTGGAFPAVAGIHFSYSQNKVKEIWKTDEHENYVDLLYASPELIEASKTLDVCIMGLKDASNNCRIGEFRYANGTVKATLKECDSKAFGCVIGKEGKREFTPRPSTDKYRIVITSYAFGGGDNYSEVLTPSDREQNPPKSKLPIRGIITDLLANSSKHTCSWEFNDTSYTSKILLEDSIVKRMYSDADIVQRHKDTPNAYCVATQKEFATRLLGSDIATCHYEE